MEPGTDFAITDFTQEHVPAAERLMLACYREARAAVPALPPAIPAADLRGFAGTGMGVAALDARTGELAGYLCGCAPFARAFGDTDAVGVFSPMHANAARARDRAAVLAAMLPAAQERWARAGASSHAVCLYAYDLEAQRVCYAHGFGLRCLDAMRTMEAIEAPALPDVRCARLQGGEVALAYPLYRALCAHLAQSPCFIRRAPDPLKTFAAGLCGDSARCFAAFAGGEAVAFLSLDAEGGETPAAAAPGTQNITGAYCRPDRRGTGLFRCLLAYAVRALAQEGFERLGVDFESINPAARRFWPKYFTPYTHGVVRRIDEGALAK